LSRNYRSKFWKTANWTKRISWSLKKYRSCRVIWALRKELRIRSLKI